MVESEVPETAFDLAAPGYDDDFTHSRSGRLQRERVHAYLKRLDRAGLDVLELGCGTGEDALFLASQGRRVLATDASAGMLAVARAKAARTTSVCAPRFEPLDLRAIAAWEPGVRFDLLFSNFGALNCLAPGELAGVGQAAARLLKPGGHAVLVVMPRFCAWEFAYFALRLRLRSAVRRLRRGPLNARLGAERVATWYHSPAALRRAFGPAFRQASQRPVGLFLPPSYLDRLVRSRPRLAASLDRLEQRLGHSSLAGLADHCLVDLELCPGRT